MNRKQQLWAGIAAGVLLVFILIFAASISRIPINSVGTRVDIITGKIHEEVLPSGIHFKIPIKQKISHVSTELRSADIDNMAVTTKDAQALSLDIEMQYRIDPTKAIETYKQFKSVKEEDWINVFVYQRIHRGVQEVASQYAIIEIMGEKRGEFQVGIDRMVADALSANYMIVHSTSVDDLQASESIVKAIEENAKSKQAVETARQQQEKQRVENQTKIEKAEAEAQVRQIAAEAEAAANRKLAESINQGLIDYKEAEARMTHGWYKYNNVNPKIMESGD